MLSQKPNKQPLFTKFTENKLINSHYNVGESSEHTNSRFIGEFIGSRNNVEIFDTTHMRHRLLSYDAILSMDLITDNEPLKILFCSITPEYSGIITAAGAACASEAKVNR